MIGPALLMTGPAVLVTVTEKPTAIAPGRAVR